MSEGNGHGGARPGAGRPKGTGEFKPEYCEQARKLCLLGATDVDLAYFFDVSEQTINNWKNAHVDFLGSIKGGKEIADMGVADRLHQRACGFEWDEVQPTKVKEVIYENGKRVRETERVENVVVHRVVPPDPTSAIFWLKNRRAVHWRDKTEVHVRHTVETMTDDELNSIARQGRERNSEAPLDPSQLN